MSSDASILSTSWVSWPREIGCYRCGEDSVQAVCHHCGRSMCSDHVRESSDSGVRTANEEFVGLGLERTPCSDRPIHCDDCSHVVRAPRLSLVIPGLVGTVAGRFLQLEMPEAGTAVLVIGILALTVSVGVTARRWWRLRLQPPVLPWVPRIRDLEVVEEIDGALSVDEDGICQNTISRFEGRVALEADFGEDERRSYELYLSRFRPRDAEGVGFHAGFLMVSGRADLAFTEGAPLATGTPNLLVLEGKTSEEAARRVIQRSAPLPWRREWTYHSRLVPDDRGLPIQVVPYVLPDSSGRKMRLELLWGPGGTNEVEEEDVLRVAPTPLKAVVVEEVELRVPMRWGETQAVGDRAEVSIVGGDTEARRRILWRKTVVGTEGVRRSRQCFEVRFEEPIELDATIEGRVVVELTPGATGVSEVAWLYPSGEESGRRSSASTRVVASFRFALASLRHRESRLVPDSKRPGERDLVKPLRIEGVIPDHATVIALGRELTVRGHYLKSVVEDRPRTGASPDTTSRLWDLVGRAGKQIQPTEFHIVLSGEETIDGAHCRGVTSVTVTMQGAYGDRRQEETVKSQWEGLRALVERTLRDRVDCREVGFDDSVGEFVGPSPASPANVADPSARELSRLRDLLLTGRISEATYQELRRELNDEAASRLFPLPEREKEGS